ncbi:MAG: hypothetical protein AUK55_08125 [Syntrophobacteraceae bacterium CG2_30_61_12]|nr:MAG: hypothetical protein AUK55_08125 [Syntrophobacteraceae bacterium CG2_30_61_12]
MRIWQGIAVAALMHGLIFLIPIQGRQPKDAPLPELQVFVLQSCQPAAAGDQVAAAAGPPTPDPVAQPEPEPERGEEPEPEIQQPPDPKPEPEPESEPVSPPEQPVMTQTPPRVIKPHKPRREAKKKPVVPLPPEAKPRPKMLAADAVPVASVQDGSGEGGGNVPGAAAAGPSGPMETAFGVGDGPGFLRKVVPRYPRLARELGKEGTVLLRLTLDANGRLNQVEVLRKAGYGLDEEALRAVRESTFRPARGNGRPVACRADLPIRFVLRSNDHD